MNRPQQDGEATYIYRVPTVGIEQSTQRIPFYSGAIGLKDYPDEAGGNANHVATAKVVFNGYNTDVAAVGQPEIVTLSVPFGTENGCPRGVIIVEAGGENEEQAKQ